MKQNNSKNTSLYVSLIFNIIFLLFFVLVFLVIIPYISHVLEMNSYYNRLTKEGERNFYMRLVDTKILLYSPQLINKNPTLVKIKKIEPNEELLVLIKNQPYFYKISNHSGTLLHFTDKSIETIKNIKITLLNNQNVEQDITKLLESPFSLYEKTRKFEKNDFMSLLFNRYISVHKNELQLKRKVYPYMDTLVTRFENIDDYKNNIENIKKGKTPYLSPPSFKDYKNIQEFVDYFNSENKPYFGHTNSLLSFKLNLRKLSFLPAKYNNIKIEIILSDDTVLENSYPFIII